MIQFSWLNFNDNDFPVIYSKSCKLCTCIIKAMGAYIIIWATTLFSFPLEVRQTWKWNQKEGERPKCLSCFPFFLEMKHFSVLSEVSHNHERPDITMTDICCWRLKSCGAVIESTVWQTQTFYCALWRQITNNLAKRHLSLNWKVNLVLRKS